MVAQELPPQSLATRLCPKWRLYLARLRHPLLPDVGEYLGGAIGENELPVRSVPTAARVQILAQAASDESVRVEGVLVDLE